MKFKRRSIAEQGIKLDIAPLIDCVFLLLIFFMLSSSFTFQSGINVKLPKAVTSDAIKEDNLIIAISSENVTFVNGKIITLKELGEELKKIKIKNSAVMIQADRRASLGRIVDVWDLCRTLGIERINIATNQD
jgi:biopolymer transport protein ExbD